MIRYIQYSNTLCKSLKLTISPGSPFQKILATLNSVEYKGCTLTTEQINYAVLELLNNSLRAHRVRGVQEPILLRFSMKPHGLEVYLRDRGGGFDINALPYPIEEDPSNIDVHNEHFERYRRKHNYQRFGLGIYLAKKTFPRFSITFVDEKGRETEWEAGNPDGTVIVLSTVAQEGGRQSNGQLTSTAMENNTIYA
jgi:anti-sigma regulatory factor (Ser/Thr protein kinase)